MEAFKHASLMLSTLRTSMLTPKNYYELYSSIFDVLSQDLSPYLVDGHMRGIHSLAHLYELVQYAGNIVPRLYLMITVGAAYMKVATLSTQTPDSTATREFENTEIPPIKELLNDLLEMARGVQHPTRGLFLRYYLSVMTRDHMPNHTTDGPLGTLSTSIHFIQQNFIEMNKLWVRLQFIGHSSERDRREAERKELRVIVGSGLVRLSQLDGLEWQDYKETVLPRLLSEIVSCKDAIAQEYLMDIIIQVFPEDFHFRTLDLLLSAASQLSKSVNVRQTVIGLIDRFIDFATRMQEEADEVQRAWDIPLFELFWEQITALVSTRNEFSLQDTAALLVSLMKLSLNCYPDRLDHVDKVL
ncbi:vacuolar protein sorting-associated protein 35, partial [Chytriomyces sp. MP71]